MVSPKELWLECKVPCADCPNHTVRTAKRVCAHPWRNYIADNTSAETNEVPFDTPETCVQIGATVSSHELTDGKRPSVQLFSERPALRHGMQVVKVANN
jgi:hypothetical protein